MALVVKDRVRETTTTTGTGTVTLAGAVAGFQSFSVIGNGNTTYYTITNNVDWEVGIGTYTSSGTTLSRDTILESSNGGAAVDFAAGTKDVFVTYPAEKSISDGYGLLPVANGGTGATSLTSGYLVKGNGTSAVSASVVYDDGTNVGIGTTSPGAKLDVAGNIITRASSDILDMGVFSNAGYIQTYNNASGIASIPMRFLIGTTERMRLDSSGNVCINTTSALGTSSGRGNLTINGTSAIVSLGISGSLAGYMLHDGTDLWLNNAGAGAQRFYTNGTERVRIDSSGNVGIGTSSPSRTFSVLSNGLVSTQLATSTSSSYADIVDGSAVTMRLGSFGGVVGIAETATTIPTVALVSGNVGIGTSSPDAKLDILGTTSDQLRLRTAETEEYRIGRNSSTGYLDFYGSQTGYTGYVFGGVDGERLRITSAGNTVIADGKFITWGNEAQGIYAENASSNLRIYTSSTERVRIDSSGNVGIGTTSPAYKLDVRTHAIASGVSGAVRIGAESDQYSIKLTSATTGLGVPYGFLSAPVDGNGWLSFYTGDPQAERMRINSSGNVGIGTSSPAGRLDISGNFVSNIVAVAASAIDCTTGNFFTKTATGALTWTITNPPSSRVYSFLLELTNGGTGTQTWFSGIKWPGGVAPTLTTSGVDVLGFYTDDNGTTWRGVQLMKDSK